MFVVCCQVDVSARDWSKVQRSPTDCGASLFMLTKPRERGGHSPRWAAEPGMMMLIIIIIIIISRYRVSTNTSTRGLYIQPPHRRLHENCDNKSILAIVSCSYGNTIGKFEYSRTLDCEHNPF
jgi:hypothetical protein